MTEPEISYFSHPHMLKFENSTMPFVCDGCKEIGIGSKFRCNHCNYNLHQHCVINSSTSSTSINSLNFQQLCHPFYPESIFIFQERPVPCNGRRHCDACDKSINGFEYHCQESECDLHPCCAKLPLFLDAAGTPLFLRPKLSKKCHRCGKKGRSWSYRSKCKKYNMHVSCAMDLLVEGCQDYFNFQALVPNIRAIGNPHKFNEHRKKEKMCCKIAKLVLQFIISAVVGDPTSFIAGIVGSFMSQ